MQYELTDYNIQRLKHNLLLYISPQCIDRLLNEITSVSNLYIQSTCTRLKKISKV